MRNDSIDGTVVYGSCSQGRDNCSGAGNNVVAATRVGRRGEISRPGGFKGTVWVLCVLCLCFVCSFP